MKIAQFREWNPKVHCSNIPKTLKNMFGANTYHAQHTLKVHHFFPTVRGVAIEIAVWASPALISKCCGEIDRSPAFDFYCG